jgi:hypothetical protein
MGTGEVAVQFPTGETWVVDMAKALWVDSYGHYFGTASNWRTRGVKTFGA